MKKLETDREKHLKILTDLIIPVTNMYPTLLKNEKKELDDLSLDRKNMAKIRPSTSIRSTSEKKSEKNYSKFLSQKIKDDKFLFMHFVRSELNYHAIMMEKLTSHPVIYQIVDSGSGFVKTIIRTPASWQRARVSWNISFALSW